MTIICYECSRIITNQQKAYCDNTVKDELIRRFCCKKCFLEYCQKYGITEFWENDNLVKI